jgi:hypothetical protein
VREEENRLASSLVDNLLKVLRTESPMVSRLFIRHTDGYSLICNSITSNRQSMDRLDVNHLVDAVLLESWRRDGMIRASDIDQCQRARSREEFALCALTFDRAVNVAPDP